jgi:hypothetical protein
LPQTRQNTICMLAHSNLIFFARLFRKTDSILIYHCLESKSYIVVWSDSSKSQIRGWKEGLGRATGPGFCAFMTSRSSALRRCYVRCFMTLRPSALIHAILRTSLLLSCTPLCMLHTVPGSSAILCSERYTYDYMFAHTHPRCTRWLYLDMFDEMAARSRLD